MRRLRFWLFVFGLAGYLSTGFVLIRPGERAVVRRFGRVLEEQPRPGLWIGLPGGMDQVDRIPIHLVRRVEVGYQRDRDFEGTPIGQLLTGDHNLVNVGITVDYTVDEDHVVKYVLHADRADSLVARAVETVLSEWIAGQTVDSVLLTRKLEMLDVLRRRTQAVVDGYGLGVRIQNAGVTHLLPPDEVKMDFDEVTRAQAGIRTREQEARQDATRKLREAQTETYRSEQMTAAYTREKLSLAEAESSRFEDRRRAYRAAEGDGGDHLNGIWREEMGALYHKLKAEGRIDLLDNRLAGDGLDIAIVPPMPGKK